MKKLFVSFILVLFTCVVTFGQKSGNEAYNEITSIQRIMLQASNQVLSAENELDLEVVHLEFDLILGSNVKYTYRTLSGGWTYIAYAEGETVMTDDIDLYMYVQNDITGEWVEVMKDNRDDFGAICSYQVSVTGNYRFAVKVGKYAEGFTGCHYYLLIAHRKPN